MHCFVKLGLLHEALSHELAARMLHLKLETMEQAC